jgi:hypothetical protein
MNVTGTLPPTENLKPNLKASPSLFTHTKSTQSVNRDIKIRLFDLAQEKGNVPVIFVSIVNHQVRSV